MLRVDARPLNGTRTVESLTLWSGLTTPRDGHAGPGVLSLAYRVLGVSSGVRRVMLA